MTHQTPESPRHQNAEPSLAEQLDGMTFADVIRLMDGYNQKRLAMGQRSESPRIENETNPGPDLRFQTFAEAEQTTVELQDQTIEDMLDSPYMHAYSYLVEVPTDDSDKAFYQSAKRRAAFFNELGDFISDKLEFFGSDDVSYETRKTLAEFRKKYREAITRDKGAVKHYLEELEAGASTMDVFNALSFYPRASFTANYNEGKPHTVRPLDFEGDSKGIRSSIRVQDGMAGGGFVHWLSSESLKQPYGIYSSDSKTRRIYLNPQIQSTVSIFRSIAEAAEAQGLCVNGKILMRTEEELKIGYADNTVDSARSEGIVMYAAKDADKLLAIIDEIYRQKPEVFSGRQVPKLTYPVADGIGLADSVVHKDDGERESFNQNRGYLLREVAQRTVSEFGIKYVGNGLPKHLLIPAKKRFREIFKEEAVKAGVSPINPAFSL